MSARAVIVSATTGQSALREEPATHTLPVVVSPAEALRSERDARLRALVDTHFDAVWRALKRLGVPDAGVDDAAQQVFLVAERRLDEIELRGERAYLLAIALRVASDARRKLRRRNEVPIDTVPEAPSEAGALPDAMLAEKRARQALQAVLAALPENLREAFVLFELEELSAPEVAEMLGVPIGTVSSRVRRARELIRQRFARWRGEP